MIAWEARGRCALGHGASVDGNIAHDGEGNPCELVRDRYSDKLERLGLHELRGPCSKTITVRPPVKEYGVGADGQQFPEIAIPHLGHAPETLLPPEEFCLGASPRNAANSRGPENALTSWTLAAIAEAVMGPIPGTLISRRAVSSVLASPMMARSLAAISWSSVCN